MREKKFSSPWGPVVHVDVIARGILVAMTANMDACLMLTVGFASRRLSEAARREGQQYQGWVCFDSVSGWAVPFWELPQEREEFRKTMLTHREHPMLERMMLMLTHARHRRYLVEKRPDLLLPDTQIVATSSLPDRQDAVIVYTADGHKHLVSMTSYRSLSWRITDDVFLGNLEVIDRDVQVFDLRAIR